MCSWEKIKELKILLPVNDGRLDYNFMDNFIQNVEEANTTKILNYLNLK